MAIQQLPKNSFLKWVKAANFRTLSLLSFTAAKGHATVPTWGTLLSRTSQSHLLPTLGHCKAKSTYSLQHRSPALCSQQQQKKLALIASGIFESLSIVLCSLTLSRQ